MSEIAHNIIEIDYQNTASMTQAVSVPGPFCQVQPTVS
jgi:hypothetical protein